MHINSPIVIITGILLIALIIFMILRNKKDRKDVEHQLNQDYRKPSHRSDEEDPEDVKGE